MGVDGLQVGLERMRRDGAPGYAIASFARAYDRLRAGERGLLAERDLEPVEDVRPLDATDVDVDAPAARRALARVAVVRLNGGLGTTLSARGGKGLLEVRPGRSFVDLAVAQVEALRRRTSCPLPLLLMQSASTEAATTAALGEARREPGPGVDRFLQSRMPRLGVDDLRPVDWPRDPTLEWAPPGHGDVYPALASSGHLRALLDAGFRHACITSVDNVAAVVDARVPALMAQEDIPFLMEVVTRTDADRKGGHLARRDGTLVVRERAQTPAEDLAAFEDVTRHRYFNSNTVWVDLGALDAQLAVRELQLDLPLIANRKRLDPDDGGSPEVIQIETAMGHAISTIPGSAARLVERSRFHPIKTTGELLAVRSDAYVVTDDHRVELTADREGRHPVVELDPSYFGRCDDLDRRFPAGPPSLRSCARLEVRGDVTFGAGVVVQGSVTVAPDGPGGLHVPDGTVLAGG